MNTVRFNTQITELRANDTDKDACDVVLQDNSVFLIDKDGATRVVGRIFAPKVEVAIDVLKNRIIEIIDMTTEEVVYKDAIYRLAYEQGQDFLEKKRRDLVSQENKTHRSHYRKDYIPEYLQEARHLTDIDGELSFEDIMIIARYAAVFQAGTSAHYTDDFSEPVFRKVLHDSYFAYMRIAKMTEEFSSYEDFQCRVALFRVRGY